MEAIDPKVHKLDVTKTARVLTGGDSSGRPMVFLHGYGMSITGFFRRLSPLVRSGHFVVAPEGLSRYYRQGASGKVVASWMTREERLDDISDTNKYLEHVFSSFCRSGSAVFTGFSQGAASVSRWAFSSDSDVREIVLWGSAFPPDIPVEEIRSAAGRIRVHFIIGTEDEYLSVDQIREDADKLQANGIETHVFVYEGKHDIYSTGLDYIAAI